MSPRQHGSPLSKGQRLRDKGLLVKEVLRTPHLTQVPNPHLPEGVKLKTEQGVQEITLEI